LISFRVGNIEIYLEIAFYSLVNGARVMEGERRAQAKRSSHEEEKKGFSVLSNTRLGIEGGVQQDGWRR
jgi:hypothetical protein